MVQVQGLLLPLTRGVTRSPAPLAVRDLTVRFGSVTAVDGVRFGVAHGEVVGLVGPNGCGKTTTLRAVVGLAEPTHGSVLVAGERAGSLAARARVAWLPDEPSGLDELTVEEYFVLFASLYRTDAAFARRAAVLSNAFGLGERGRSFLGSLSHGLRRIVAFVAAAAYDPPLLVVDEATAALDPSAAVVLGEVVRAHARRGRGVLVATQDLGFAADVCARLVLLDRGRARAEGTVESLIATFGGASLAHAFAAAVGRREQAVEVRHALEAL